MSLNAVNILGINITIISKNLILEYIQKYLNTSKQSAKPLVIVTPNPEQIVLAHENQTFAEVLNRADIAIPDGIGVVIAARVLNSLKIQRITGVELMQDLVAEAAEQSITIGLIGGRAGVAVKALERLQQQYPRLKGWAWESLEVDVTYRHSDAPSGAEGSNLFRDSSGLALRMTVEQSGLDITEEYMRKIVKKIKETKTKMVFVGLGAPKQEYFIEKLRKELSIINYQLSIILMSVGGSFDELSGRLPQTPKLIDQIGLKWLWRLAIEPWRWRRQLALIKFVWMVVKKRSLS